MDLPSASLLYCTVLPDNTDKEIDTSTMGSVRSSSDRVQKVRHRMTCLYKQICKKSSFGTNPLVSNIEIMRDAKASSEDLWDKSFVK